MLGEGKMKILGVLPNIGCSYVVDENHEPMLTYYRPNSGLFCSAPLSKTDEPYFLNLRHPLLIDVEDVAPIDMPQLPAECDGMILRNFGKNKITAFYVKDKNTQSMSLKDLLNRQ